MILQALNDYYRRKCDDADPAQRLPVFGLEQKEIPFVLEITRDGTLVQLTDTRTPNGKKKVAQTFRVPLGVKRAAGVVSNLLWDTPEYALGVDGRGNPERVAQQHAHFLGRIKALPQAAQEDAGIQAILAFLANLNLAQLQAQPAWAQALESNSLMSFRLHGDVDLVCQRPDVVQAVLNIASDPDDPIVMCLVTGADAPVQRLHASIKGVWGAQSVGANIVSFNLPAFESYGKTKRQGENAPVSQAAAFAYTTALNHLLRKDSSQRIQVGDASTVFWSEKESDFETAIPDIFGEPPKDDPDQCTRAVHALFAAMQTGKLGGEEEGNRFHVLGLAPNAARISIRFYHCLPLRELGQRIVQYFDDLEIARGPKDPQYPSLFRLLAAVAVQGKADNIPPNLGGAIVDAVFAGSDVPYPSLWLNAAVGRCRAEQNVTYLRAAAIKACLNRQIRRSSVTSPSQSPEKEFLPMLDLSNPSPAYRMGRLFAALEKIQEEASPGLNATIRDRYYGAASSTPVAVFTALLRLKNSHLKKLPDKRGMWFEKLISEILATVADFPKHLPLPDQGRFALGYYHQRQDFFTKKADPSTPAAEGTPA
ncbi:MAG: type CRISPR-associated protein Cas8c/Csd1 [Polaromonas sp.]|jgi:CRISPR-associated protein Csd1|nr:type CRISPR-associated protein Cas8c/Csd1 [Polaromonas sp.]